jgi:hypothetical protein
MRIHVMYIYLFHYEVALFSLGNDEHTEWSRQFTDKRITTE